MSSLSNYEININIDRQKKNEELWTQVFSIKSKSIDELPETEIFNGWRRSISFNLNPFAKSVELVLDQNELNLLLEENSEFLDISRPMLYNLNSYVAEAGFNVAISDKNGIILTVMGEYQAVDSTRAGNWVAGADWSERSIGNNGIGTALHLNKPLMMIGYEHYSRCCHYFASAVSPIRKPDGGLLGAIALCGRFEKIHYHTLGMVMATAKAIEIQIEINRSLKEKENINYYHETIFNSITDSIISTNIDGQIKYCNARCSELLNIDSDKLLGLNISSIFDERIIKLLMDKSQQINDKVVFLNVFNRSIKCLCTAHHLVGTGEADGLVIALRDYESVVRLASKIVKNKPRWLFNNLVGKSSAFQEVLRVAQLAAQTDSNVFILGESGTGKDVLAQAIHNASRRANEPFVAVNCGAIPKDLIASELFGYSEGAFTGARKGGYSGKFEIAQNGTVFLDEIGEMPMEQQVVLLRVLDEALFTRIGSTEKISFNARIIAATNKNITEAIRHNLFRNDLFFRLNVFTITISPLRSRPEDIEELANTYLKKITERAGYFYSPLSEETLQVLYNYDWPGNIRELQNVLERALIISSYGLITPETILKNNLMSSPYYHNSLELPPTPKIPIVGRPLVPSVNGNMSQEAQRLIQDLERNKWNISKTSKQLNIARSTLYRWLKKFSISIKVN